MTNNSKTSLSEANAALRSGNYSDAVRLYEKLLIEAPSLAGSLKFNLTMAKRRATKNTLGFFPQQDQLKTQVETSIIKERIIRSNLFDSDWYKITHHAALGFFEDPLDHYCKYGGEAGLKPSALFDSFYYASQIPESDRAQITNYLYHYLTEGFDKYDPNEYFDTAYYTRVYLRSTEEMTPLEHYASQQYPFRNNPSQIFCNKAYLDRNLDVDNARMLPLTHFLSSGQAEGRLKSLNLSHDDAESYFVSLTSIDSTDDVIVYLAYTPDNRLSDFQQAMIKEYIALGFKVILCINSGDYANVSNNFNGMAPICLVRENIGWDFGGWKAVVNKLPMLTEANSISFTNDSIAFAAAKSERKEFIKKLRSSLSDIVTLTANKEIKHHHQSYFFCIKKSGIEKNALSIIRSIEYHIKKEKVIWMLELGLWDKFVEMNLSIETLFDIKFEGNPTIKHWDYLIKKGFPFIKLQLFTSNIISSDDSRLRTHLNEVQIKTIQTHLQSRNGPASYFHPSQRLNSPVHEAVPCNARYGSIGQLQAYNPPESHVPTVQVPLIDIGKLDQRIIGSQSLLVVIHCFYLDIAKAIFEKLTALNALIDYFVLCTTDTFEKKEAIQRLLNNASLKGGIEVTPNRGRDVAPFLIAGRQYYSKYTLILHLHTKRSPHSSAYAKWGEFLFNNLIGSAEIILSNIALLSSASVGIVYSEHFPAVKQLRNWGYDFSKAKSFLSRVGVDISSDMLLEFPTSTMFFARTSALLPYFNLNLTYEDFDEENGQIDGTLAHAIERSFLYSIEARGYSHYKVISSTHNKDVIAWRFSADQLDSCTNRIQPIRLLGSQSNSLLIGYTPQPCNILASKNAKPRFNILIPTLKPEKIYGGVSSALKVAREIYEEVKCKYDLRIIITSDEKCSDSLLQAYSRVTKSIVSAMPNDDYEFPSVIDYHYYSSTPLSLRANDVFFATAWWTADIAYKLQQRQASIYGSSHRVLYLIQDFEPGFYAWSENSALARATYTHPKTVAIINSEELLVAITRDYSFKHTYYLPYRLNETLARHKKSGQKEKLIIIYGRPSVERNLFNIIIKGLKIWQCDNPEVNCEYKICFAGEPFDSSLVSCLENAFVVGKASLEDYANILNRASVGISLMESPHPSYPPLEMAAFGCAVVTNNYQNKNLTLRSSNIFSLLEITPESLMNGLYGAIELSSSEHMSTTINDLPVDCPPFDANAIAALLP